MNRDLHPKHIYRSLSPYVTPRLRDEDRPCVDDFNWYQGEVRDVVWCEDKQTNDTLFVCPPPKTMREALLMGFMMGRASGYKEYDYAGLDLLRGIFEEDLAHYQLYGYYPDEVPPSPPPASEANDHISHDMDERYAGYPSDKDTDSCCNGSELKQTAGTRLSA